MVEHNWNAGSTTPYVRTRRQSSACAPRRTGGQVGAFFGCE